MVVDDFIIVSKLQFNRLEDFNHPKWLPLLIIFFSSLNCNLNPCCRMTHDGDIMVSSSGKWQRRLRNDAYRCRAPMVWRAIYRILCLEMGQRAGCPLSQNVNHKPKNKFWLEIRVKIGKIRRRVKSTRTRSPIDKPRNYRERQMHIRIALWLSERKQIVEFAEKLFLKTF